ncbi:hypothetical protein RQP46_007449 [Phenoliferia psychrophenolica]
METDFEGWNKASEVQLAQLFDPKRPVPTAFANSLSTDHEKAMLQTMDALRTSSAAVKHDCFLLQRDITRFVVERVAEDPVSAKWGALNEAARRRLLLAALRETCLATSDMPPRRGFVPEIVVPVLSKGDALLKLLDRACFDEMLPKDQADGEYVKVENVRWNQMVGKITTNSPALKDHIVADMHDSRHTFLFLFLLSVLLALYDLSQQYVPTKHTNALGSEDANGRKILAQSGMEAGEIDEKLKGWSKEWKAAGRLCAACNTVDRALAPGKKMQKDCQTRDWKRHKVLCGQPVASATPRTFVDSTPVPKRASKSDEAAGIPAPAPGFKHSPALIAQIEALKEMPDASYVLFLPNPAPANAGVAIPDAMGAIFFGIMRKRAMENGDPEAVGMMYKQLENSAMLSAEGFVLGKEGLKKQLFQEYGVNVDEELKRKAAATAVAGAGREARSGTDDLRKRFAHP